MTFFPSLLLFASLSTTTWLRIIQINDVYELDNLSRLKTLVDTHRQQHPKNADDADDSSRSIIDQCLVVCAGDFLAPSLLSSLDGGGTSMVDILNMVGMDYVCLGNHEADVGDHALVQRLQQSRFQWINSNVPNLDEKLQIPPTNEGDDDTTKTCRTLEYDVITVGNNNKKVALLGFLTEDPSLYRPAAFGGATIQPVLTCAHELIQQLHDTTDVDVIVPMTHQGIAADRIMAKSISENARYSNKVPVLIGGHDHEPYLETIQHDGRACRIVKTGMDAEKAALIDLTWTATDDDDDTNTEDATATPSVSIELLDTADLAPDPVVQERIQQHQQILKELDRAKLFRVSDWSTAAAPPPPGSTAAEHHAAPVIFSTSNNRLGPSTGTTALCSMIRVGLRCQVALLNAGCVRAGKDYEADTHFTWSDLKAEMPFSTEICVCRLPGRVLQETIQHSRRFASQGTAAGGYLHASQTTVFNNDGTIQSILGKPFDPDGHYLTAFPYDFLNGIDNHKPLLEWAAAAKSSSNDDVLPDPDSAIPAKIVLVEVLSALFWLQLESFEQIAGDDGILCKNDLRQHMKQIYSDGDGNADIADLMVDNVFGIADKDSSGEISALEQMIVRFVARDMLNHVVTADELKMMKQVVSNVMGCAKDDKSDESFVETMVVQLLKSLDLRGTGSVQREEILQALGDVTGKDLLQ